MNRKQIVFVAMAVLTAYAAAAQQNPIFKGKKVLLVAATTSPTGPVLSLIHI